MKKLSLFFQIVMLLVVAGCTSERLETVQEKAITNLVATLPATTRTHLNSTAVEWDNTDELGVFSDSHSALVRYTYSSQNSDGAVFHGDKVEGTKNFYAFYPYKASSKVNGTKITYTLPTEQIYAQGSFATGVCPMAATSTDQKFYFKQTCGIVRVNLTGTGAISKIVLRGNNNELLSGPGEVDLGATSPGFSVLSGVAGAEKVVRMSCNVQLSSTATSFYFVIPAQTFTKGLNITITGTFNGQEKELVKNTDKVVEIPRAVIKNFTAVDTNAMLEEEGASPGDGDNPDFYTSSDYSKDGKVLTLQTATLQKGEQGVDLILLGDGFSDRMIARGDYESVMQRAMTAFFSEEPYRSFRKYFNVYSVVAVSENEEYSEGTKTKFSCGFGEGTYVYGNNELCFEYAQKIPSLQTKGLDDAMIVVMLNSTHYAGTCFMYYNPGLKNSYGRGASVSYFPLGTSDNNLATVLLHEAGGHGFAKLHDEYAYESQGQMPLETIADETLMYNDYGWNKNVDFTSEVTQVKWAKFITDSRYAGQGLGVFEGACTYWTGAYRPTNNSIMNDNTGGFNAPSREAIYYRIHKLVHGNDWVYNYEDFVQWDAKNRSVKRTIQASRKDFVPLHPPVKILGTWK